VALPPGQPTGEPEELEEPEEVDELEEPDEPEALDEPEELDDPEEPLDPPEPESVPPPVGRSGCAGARLPPHASGSAAKTQEITTPPRIFDARA
jgi:hypothetical protein